VLGELAAESGQDRELDFDRLLLIFRRKFMKVRTAELTGPALEWAVAMCEGKRPEIWEGLPYVEIPNITARHLPSLWGYKRPAYSTDWNLGGPIVARELIDIYHVERSPTLWVAEIQIAPKHRATGRGNTPLTAAMRCYCCAKLGETIEIPEALCQQQST
jgi:hypothetical protein